MHEAIVRMLSKYTCQGLDDYINALREILQEIALLGLWRGKLFEKGAFYGGTCLRVLYGLDRFSEDLDFSLLEPMDDFNIGIYMDFLKKELEAFGFDVWVEDIDKVVTTPIQSTFLKANTRNQILLIGAEQEITQTVPKGQILKIKLEVDTDPPSGFSTQTRYLLQPVPFAVRAFVLQDLFAGKMHAILCRKWKNRVKGRDWYDFVWYAANYPKLHLSHLEQRMRQTGHWKSDAPLRSETFRERLDKTIHGLDVEQARKEVEPFIKEPESLSIWSRDFFLDVASRIEFV
jgi:hypothetical protein